MLDVGGGLGVVGAQNNNQTSHSWFESNLGENIFQNGLNPLF